MRFTLPSVAAIGLAALAATGAAAASAMIFSDYRLAPGGELVLGDHMAGGYSLSGQNVGPVAVTVLAREDGHDHLLARVEPGASLHQEFDRGEAAVVANTSPGKEAVVMVRMGAGNHTGAAGGPGHKFEAE